MRCGSRDLLCAFERRDFDVRSTLTARKMSSQQAELFLARKSGAPKGMNLGTGARSSRSINVGVPAFLLLSEDLEYGALWLGQGASYLGRRAQRLTGTVRPKPAGHAMRDERHSCWLFDQPVGADQ